MKTEVKSDKKAELIRNLSMKPFCLMKDKLSYGIILKRGKAILEKEKNNEYYLQ